MDTRVLETHFEHLKGQVLEIRTCLKKEVKRDLVQIKIDIAGLKVKSGIWGFIGGAIPVAIALGIWALKGTA